MSYDLVKEINEVTILSNLPSATSSIPKSARSTLNSESSPKSARSRRKQLLTSKEDKNSESVSKEVFYENDPPVEGVVTVKPKSKCYVAPYVTET